MKQLSLHIPNLDTELEVVKEFTWDSAHRLPKHPGKCRNLHGHTYRLQVGFRGKIDPETGLVVDFGDIKKLIKEKVVDKLDHKYLNDLTQEEVPGFPSYNTTAELMVEWLVRILPPEVSFIRLYETPTSFVEWRRK